MFTEGGFSVIPDNKWTFASEAMCRSGCHWVPTVPVYKLLFLVGMLNPPHMIPGFLSNSLSAGLKLLGVERGSNSPDLPAQLLLDATLHNSLLSR